MGTDLLSWPKVQEARAALDAAARERIEAARRLRCAPHGEVLTRQAALAAATTAALKAELALKRAEVSE